MGFLVPFWKSHQVFVQSRSGNWVLVRFAVWSTYIFFKLNNQHGTLKIPKHDLPRWSRHLMVFNSFEYLSSTQNPQQWTISVPQDLGVSINGGCPIAGWFSSCNIHSNMDDFLGQWYPYCRTPRYIYDHFFGTFPRERLEQRFSCTHKHQMSRHVVPISQALYSHRVVVFISFGRW